MDRKEVMHNRKQPNLLEELIDHSYQIMELTYLLHAGTPLFANCTPIMFFPLANACLKQSINRCKNSAIHFTSPSPLISLPNLSLKKLSGEEDSLETIPFSRPNYATT